MNRYFGDTSFFIALLVSDDVAHAKAVQIISKFPRPIVTTQWVFIELGNHFAVGTMRQRYCEFVDEIAKLSAMTIVAVSPDDFERGLDLYRSRMDKEWSLVDCISFNTMQAMNLTDALATDHHFEQAGFNVLLK